MSAPALRLSVARRWGDEARQVREAVRTRRTGVSAGLALAARAHVRARAADRAEAACEGHRRELAGCPALLTFFGAVDDWQALRLEMQRRPIGAVVRWTEIGQGLLSS